MKSSGSLKLSKPLAHNCVVDAKAWVVYVEAVPIDKSNAAAGKNILFISLRMKRWTAKINLSITDMSRLRIR
jgi:hypothetical protein